MTTTDETSSEVPPSPASTLKALAGALETKVGVPEQARIVEILASFKASGLDRPTQEMIIEAREDAKQDRAPDPLALRMIAKALETVGAKKKPKPAPISAAPKGLRPISAAPGLKDWIPSDLTDVDRMEAREADFAKAVLDHFPAPVRQDLDAGIAALREQSDRAVAALTDREREVLDKHFKTAPWPDGNGAPPPLKKNGNGAAVAAFARGVGAVVDRMSSDELASLPRAFDQDDIPPVYVTAIMGDEPDEITPARTDAEWIAHAADVIEHLDMPAHAELCGELYALAQRLEENPLYDPSAAPLLARVEHEITRRIEKAIKSPADLPTWVIEWARIERDRS